MSRDYLKKEYDTWDDPHAKKNRDSKAQELREQGYHVTCGRETHVRGGDSIYVLFADKEITEEIRKEEEEVYV